MDYEGIHVMDEVFAHASMILLIVATVATIASVALDRRGRFVAISFILFCALLPVTVLSAVLSQRIDREVLEVRAGETYGVEVLAVDQDRVLVRGDSDSFASELECFRHDGLCVLTVRGKELPRV